MDRHVKKGSRRDDGKNRRKEGYSLGRCSIRGKPAGLPKNLSGLKDGSEYRSEAEREQEGRRSAACLMVILGGKAPTS